MKRALRVLAGAVLLGLAIWYADPRALWRALADVNPWLFGAAVAVAVLGNLVSALRWSLIARGLGLIAPFPTTVLMYARGITANMMLPGSIVSGDVLRSFQLSRLGNPLVASAWSVFLDRFSGLWMLCAMSTLAALGVAIWQPEIPMLFGYAAILAVVVLAPLLPLPLPRTGRWAKLAHGLLRARPVLLASAGHSCAVQCLAAGTLWICGLSVGLALSYPMMLAAAAPIFVMASLPIGIAGFGAREMAAVAVLGVAGVPGEQAIATGLLYGLAAVIQGIVAVPLFFAKA